MLQPEPHLPVTPIIADILSLDPFSSQRRRHQAVGCPIPAAMGSQPLPSASDEQLASKLLLINDLPDGVLVEILCRLPYKYARRNKRVCKRWLALISNSYFAARILCMQIDRNKPITLLRTLLFSNTTAKPSPAGFTFRHIIFDALLWKTSIAALHLIPRFKGTKEKLVVAMYNDLVLCCLTKDDPHKYYICNPNARQCVALPPAPPTPQDRTSGIHLRSLLCQPRTR
nr:F-box protein At5g07610-like isoform X2 [Malus domestica]